MDSIKLDSLGRRIPKRTESWKKNIGNANRKGIWRECKCGKKFWVFPSSFHIQKNCSMVCQRKFRKYGQNKGKKCPAGSVAKLKEKNPRWKGDSASVATIHEWVNNNFKKPLHCEICKKEAVYRLDWSNKNHKYSRLREDWHYVCRKCHRKWDIRNNNGLLNSGLFKKGSTKPANAYVFPKGHKYYGKSREKIV